MFRFFVWRLHDPLCIFTPTSWRESASATCLFKIRGTNMTWTDFDDWVHIPVPSPFHPMVICHHRRRSWTACERIHSRESNENPTTYFQVHLSCQRCIIVFLGRHNNITQSTFLSLSRISPAWSFLFFYWSNGLYVSDISPSLFTLHHIIHGFLFISVTSFWKWRSTLKDKNDPSRIPFHHCK
jgi:hypothetical protein